MYVFAIGNRRIERVALMPVRPPYITGDEPADRMKLGERDFTLMGFGLNQPFEPNKYNMWTNLVKRNNSNFWLYGDYGVEVDRRNIVQKVFLLTNNAYTGRGATLGYRPDDPGLIWPAGPRRMGAGQRKIRRRLLL